jgi:multicomponent Na+:H+ antiporter subunit D
MKGTLFLALGAVVYRLGSVTLNDLAGAGRRMPLTFAAFVIGGLGIIGTPGTAGFISKWYLAIGAMDRGWWPLVFLIVASSLIAVVYIGRVVEVAYFRPMSAAVEELKDPPLSMMLPILILAAATIYFGFDTELSAGIASRAAEALVEAFK